MREITDSTSSPVYTNDGIAQKLQREAYVFSTGTIGGACNEFSKHPLKTVSDTLVMGATAVGLTAVAAAELPVISFAAAATGAVCGGVYAWNFLNPNNPHNIERNRSLTSAMTTAWNTADNRKLETSIMDLQSNVGADALQTMQLLAVGGAAGKLSLRTVDFVRSAATARPIAFATESAFTPAPRIGAEPEVPTWNEYLNFSKRHGPVIQKSIHQFELESAVKAQAKETNANHPVSQKTVEVKASPLKKDAKISHSQGSDDDDSQRGASLYFSDRFGRFHH